MMMMSAAHGASFLPAGVGDEISAHRERGLGVGGSFVDHIH